MDYKGLNAKIMAMSSRLLRSKDYELLSGLKSVEDVGLALKEHPAYREAMKDLEAPLHRGMIEEKLLFGLTEDFAKIYHFTGDFNVREYLDGYHLRKELHMEQQMDSAYYLHLRKLQNRCLNKSDKKIAGILTGTEIDLRNIIWIYRLKTYHSLPPQMIYTRLIPLGYRLKPADLNHLAQARDKQEFLFELSHTSYGYVFKLTDQSRETSAGSEQRVEDAYYREMNKIHRFVKAMYPNSLAVTIWYLYFKKLEIRNITSLLEGVRYGLKPVEIMRYVR